MKQRLVNNRFFAVNNIKTCTYLIHLDTTTKALSSAQPLPPHPPPPIICLLPTILFLSYTLKTTLFHAYLLEYATYSHKVTSQISPIDDFLPMAHECNLNV